MPIKVSLADTKSFQPPAEGDYAGEIKQVPELRYTSSGDPMLSVRWIVQEGDVEKSIFDNVCLAGPGAFKARQLFIAVGMADTDEEVDGLEFELQDLLGARATLRVKHEIWTEEQGGDGSLQARVKSMRRITGPPSGGKQGGLFGRK